MTRLQPRTPLPQLLIAAAALLAITTGLANADELRNVKQGQAVPDFSLQSLAGQVVTSADYKGAVTIITYLSAQQKSSESAATDAHNIVQAINESDLKLLYTTADVTRGDYFRNARDKAGLHEPLLLDVDRDFYGRLGIIVLPTTIVVDKEGRLAHVISGYKSDYEHVLDTYVQHTLGRINDAELERRLATKSYRRDTPASRAARHRATAKLLREKGLLDNAADELNIALGFDPENAEIKLDLASLHLLRDQIDEADKIVMAILADQPRQRHALLLSGIILYHKGQLDESKKVLTDVLLLNPDPARTHYYLGLICEKQGEPADAMKHYRAALERLLGEPGSQ